jgi:multiple sugar transport system substrate-binding protein
MKKSLFLFVSLGAVSALASCGGTPAVSSSVAPATSSAPTTSVPTTSVPTTSVTPTTSIPDDQKITITYKSTTGKDTQPYLEAYLAEFNKTYPQYKAVAEYYSGSYDALKQDTIKGFSAGNYPDLVQCYPDHVAEYINYGKGVNLDTYIDDAEIGLSAEDKADYVPAYLEEGKQFQVSGTYLLPNSKSTELMFWNKGVLNGLKLPGVNGGNALGQAYFDNLTWEELFNVLCPAIVTYDNGLEAGKKILKTDQAYHAVFGYDSDDNLFITLAAQYGYDYTSINTTTGKGSADFVNDGMKSLMKTFHTAANNGYIISKGSAGGSFTNTFFTKQNTLFSVGSTGGVKHQYDKSNPMDVGVARIPHADGKDPKVISQGPGVTVLSHGTDETGKLRAKGAYLLWKTMTTAKNSLNWAMNSGYMPIRTSSYADESYIAANDETQYEVSTLDRLMARSNTYGAKLSNDLFTSPVFIGSSACRNAGSAIMTYALTKGDITDEALAAKFTEQYNNAVKNIQ